MDVVNLKLFDQTAHINTFLKYRNTAPQNLHYTNLLAKTLSDNPYNS
jgi:hypothetical protein